MNVEKISARENDKRDGVIVGDSIIDAIAPARGVSVAYPGNNSGHARNQPYERSRCFWLTSYTLEDSLRTLTRRKVAFTARVGDLRRLFSIPSYQCCVISSKGRRFPTHVGLVESGNYVVLSKNVVWDCLTWSQGGDQIGGISKSVGGFPFGGRI